MSIEIRLQSRDSVRQHRDLVTPAVPCFRGAMEKKNWRPLAGFDPMHPDAVELGRMVSNVHEQEL